MFVSDRELRRPPGGGGKKGPNGRGSGGPAGKEDIVEKARLEREQRERLRIETVKATTIQCFWRGRHASRSLMKVLSADIAKKLSDLEKVTVMLKTSKGIDFVPPLNVVTPMLPTFVYVYKRKSAQEALETVLRFCKLIISPLSAQPTSEKNMLSIFCGTGNSPDSVQVQRGLLFRDLLSVLLKSLPCHCVEKPVTDIITSIKNLLGCGIPESAVTLPMYKAVRLFVVEKCYWFECARKVMIPLVVPLVKPMVSDENGISDIKNIPAFKIAQCICNELFVLSLWLTDVSSNVDATVNFYLSQLARDIFTVPILSALFNTDTSTTLATWSLKSSLMRRWCSPNLALPSSPVPAFQSGHWLVGNLAGLSAIFCSAIFGSSSMATSGAVTSIKRDDIDKENLSIYLATITPLILKYYIPGVFKSSRNAGGIVWMRTGVQMVASGIPILLQEQILRLLDAKFCRDLYMNLLVPLRQEAGTLGTAEDKKNVAEALSSSGVSMLKQSVIDKTAESNAWIGSKWASKIGTGLARMFGGGGADRKETAADFVATSMESAEEPKSPMKSSAATLKTFHQPLPETTQSPDINLLLSLFKLWSILLPQASLSSPEAKSWKLLSSFAFSTRVVDRTWVAIHILNLERFVENFSPRDIATEVESPLVSAVLSLGAILKIALMALDDSELYEHGYPLPLHQILRMVRCFKVILYRCLSENPSSLVEPADVSVAAAASSDHLSNQVAVTKAVEAFYKYHALRVIADVLSNLYARWARRPFARSELWEVSDTASRRFKTELLSNYPCASAVLSYLPWCIEFHQRLVYFRTTVDAERRAVQGSDTDPSFRSMGTSIRIRKNMLLEDGMNAMDHLSAPALKDRIVVHYINEFGEEEKGIDAGGLIKDFWTDISNRVFNPSFGLFSVTESQLLYPNHNALALYPKDEIEKLYYFVGRVLGKALFENMTVQPQFAHFFLAYINGRYNFVNLIDDLCTFDPELYKNLMFLKSYDGDIADLSLTFSVSDDAYGVQKEVDLMPGGASMSVTTHNRHRYINLVAKYYLHDRIHLQAGAFFRGLNQVIRPDQLCIFCAPELQVLISGTSSGISVEDLRANTQYAGGYHSVDRTIAKFWTVLETLEEADRALLLKFVTSCERPPSLGFAALQPPFTIQRVESEGDSRLPTASTCFNILKLPAYSNKTILKEKLLFSIRSGSGFDLS